MLSTAEIEELRRARLTYAEVGLSRGAMPDAFGHLRRSRVIGTGSSRFLEAAEVLLTWQMHRRAGLSVRASSEFAIEGAVAVLRMGWGPVGLNAPVRIIYTVDKPHRRGFAYGTLPGHPESGEEAFVVELDENDQVHVDISAFSRPASRLARAGGPVSRAVQRWVTNRYLQAF
jgi:uncharacterized protein (UPF0548 family)